MLQYSSHVKHSFLVKSTFLLPLAILLLFFPLDDLLESTVDGRADVGDLLPEIDRGNSPLGDTLGGELELL
jgi:hypothetical protein